jgi:hypothetical protein
VVSVDVLSQYLPGGTEKKHVNFKSICLLVKV